MYTHTHTHTHTHICTHAWRNDWTRKCTVLRLLFAQENYMVNDQIWIYSTWYCVHLLYFISFFLLRIDTQKDTNDVGRERKRIMMMIIIIIYYYHHHHHHHHYFFYFLLLLVIDFVWVIEGGRERERERERRDKERLVWKSDAPCGCT